MTVKKKVDKMLSHFVTPPFLIQKKLGKDGQALSFIYGGDEGD